MRERKQIVFLTVILCALVVLFGLVETVKAAEPIKMGVISAWDFIGGHGAKRGAEMAVRDINSAGGYWAAK